MAAVFSAVGLIGSFGVRNYYQRRQLKSRYLVPFMAGFGIFAMLGTSPQTDVSAHLFGFLSGALLGLLFMPLLNFNAIGGKLVQTLSFLLACAIVYGSWAYALGF